MRVNEVELHVLDEGASDIPLLLVHGYTGGTSDFDDVAPTLAKHRRVIRYDHRGHARSENTGDPNSYGFDSLVTDLAAVIDAMGLDQIDLLGHSMGGVVSMRYALANPTKLRSLILMDTAAAPAGQLPIDLIDALAERGRDEGMQVVGEVMAPLIGALQDRLSEQRRQVLAQRNHSKMLHMDPEAFSRLARELNTYPSMVHQLKNLACPTTVIVGENDAGLIPGSKVMAKEIPGAQLVVIADAGHSPQEDRPDEWLRVVAAHLSRVES